VRTFYWRQTARILANTAQSQARASIGTTENGKTKKVTGGWVMSIRSDKDATNSCKTLLENLLEGTVLEDRGEWNIKMDLTEIVLKH
jgi:hypothetical protein